MHDDTPDDRTPPRTAERFAAICRAPVDAAARAFGMPPEMIRRLALSYVVGISAGIVFQMAALPLPWLLGPLTISLLLATRNRPLAPPSGLVHPARSLIGVAVGSSFTPALVEKASGAAVSLAMLLPYTAALCALGYFVLRRFAHFDKPTAFFASAPGGLADMLTFAHDSGADLRRVTLVQAARVVTTVFAIPFWLQFVAGKPLGGAMPASLHFWQLGLIDAPLILFLAWDGWRIADRFGILGASIVGPMLLSGLAHGFALTTVKVPVEVLIFAQVTIGVVIGAQFRGISLSEFVSVLSWGLAIAALLLVTAGAMALLAARLTGLDPTSLLLSYAPGGQNEMAIMGLILGADVAIIALHHFLRVIMVVLGAQYVFQSNKDWRRDRK
jgi:membrane AbrB-like protein